MAIQKIEIIESNKVGDCDLLAAHNPLVYTIKMTLDDSGDDYDDVIEVNVNSSGNESESFGTYYAVFFKQLNTNERIYIFNADEIIRSGLNTIEDYDQDFNDPNIISDTFSDKYLVKGFYLTFIADASGTPIEVIEDLSAVNSSRGFESENGASLVDLCQNKPEIYIGAYNKQTYTYEYFGRETYTWGIDLADLMVDGNVQGRTYMNNDGAFVTIYISDSHMSRGKTNRIINSPEYGEVDYRPTMKTTPTLPNEVQIGLNKNETISNLIEYFNTIDVAGNAYYYYNESDGKEYILFNSLSRWFKPDGISSMLFQLDGFEDASDDGNIFGFEYTGVDSILRHIELTARVTPTLPNEFEVNTDLNIVAENIMNALILADTYFTDFDNILVSTALLLQEPQVTTDIPGIFATIPGAKDATPQNRSEWVWDALSYSPTFLRKKILVDTYYPFVVKMNNVNQVIFPKEFCDDSLYLKYLDKNGQYRFMVCEKPTKTTSPKTIGDIERIVTSLRTDLGSKINVGKNGNTYITVNLNNLRSDLSVNIGGTDYLLDEIALLEDLYNSPDIQLEIVPDKWISVMMKGGGKVSKPKGTVYSTTLKLELPKKYNITKL